jgi:large subunit ribosomal protein L15
VVTLELLRQAGFVNGQWDGVKVLGNGEISKKIVVKADAFSTAAKEKIEAAGGSCEII